MTEVAFDIARGATFKFNTALGGEQVRQHNVLEVTRKLLHSTWVTPVGYLGGNKCLELNASGTPLQSCAILWHYLESKG